MERRNIIYKLKQIKKEKYAIGIFVIGQKGIGKINKS